MNYIHIFYSAYIIYSYLDFNIVSANTTSCQYFAQMLMFLNIGCQEYFSSIISMSSSENIRRTFNITGK